MKTRETLHQKFAGYQPQNGVAHELKLLVVLPPLPGIFARSFRFFMRMRAMSERALQQLRTLEGVSDGRF